jgi:hypothetical protein
LGTE